MASRKGRRSLHVDIVKSTERITRTAVPDPIRIPNGVHLFAMFQSVISPEIATIMQTSSFCLATAVQNFGRQCAVRRSKPLQKIQVRLGTWQALIATEKGIGNFGRQPRAAISRKRLKKKPFRKHVIGDVGQQLRR